MSRREHGTDSKIISQAEIIALGSGSVPTDQRLRQCVMVPRVSRLKCGKLIHALRKLHPANQSLLPNSAAICTIGASMQRAGPKPRSKICSQIDGRPSSASAGGTKGGRTTTGKHTTPI